MSRVEERRSEERDAAKADTLEREAAFRNAVAVLEAALKESADLGGDRFLQNRKRVIDLRRQIMACISNVSVAGQQAFADTAHSASFRAGYARMRTAMALHHASWPVIAIDMDNPNYQASIQAMRLEYRAFIRWSQTAVGV